MIDSEPDRGGGVNAADGVAGAFDADDDLPHTDRQRGRSGEADAVDADDELPPSAPTPYADLFSQKVERQRGDTMRMLRSAFRLGWQADRRSLTCILIVEAVNGLGGAATLLLIQRVFSTVLGTDDRHAAFSKALPLAIVLVVLTVGGDTFAGLRERWRALLSERVRRLSSERLMDAVTGLDLLAFESPEFHDRFRRSESGAEFRPMQIVEGIVFLPAAALNALGMAGAVFVIQPLVLPVVLAANVPLWLAIRRVRRDVFDQEIWETPLLRKRAYYRWLLSDRSAAAELRVFGLAPVLRRRFGDLSDQHLDEIKRRWRWRSRQLTVSQLLSALLLIATFVVVLAFYRSGRMSLAGAGAAVIGLQRLAQTLSGLQWPLGQLYEGAMFLADSEAFLELSRVAGAAPGHPAPPFGTVTLEAVSFSYPDAAKPALERVDLVLRPGEVVALVGENGSGKTTLAKVLAGLYRPSSGAMRWDDVDVASVGQAELSRSATVVFQDFQRYNLTARDNIAFGDPARLDDHEAVALAARRAGAGRFLEPLPDGYETMLGRMFEGGRDLSVGQWQRMAVARAFFRNTPLVILDEPTAALDPRAEHDLFDRIRELFAGRTVVLISHRFSTVRSADRIYVLHQGRIVEHGSHLELMAAAGTYAELFTLQAEAYLDDADGVN